MTVTLSNLKPDEGETVTIALRGEEIHGAEGRILTGKMDQYNDFDNAPLQAEAFRDFEVKNGELHVQLPPCSVAEIRL